MKNRVQGQTETWLGESVVLCVCVGVPIRSWLLHWCEERVRDVFSGGGGTEHDVDGLQFGELAFQEGVPKLPSKLLPHSETGDPDGDKLLRQYVGEWFAGEEGVQVHSGGDGDLCDLRVRNLECDVLDVWFDDVHKENNKTEIKQGISNQAVTNKLHIK